MAKTIEVSNFFSNKINLLAVVVLVAAVGYGTYNFTYQTYEAPLKFDVFTKPNYQKTAFFSKEVIGAAKNFGDDLDLQVHFYLQENDGSIESDRGEDALAESLRQLCMQKHYSDAVYMDYLLCVNEDIKNSSIIWEGCAVGAGIDTAATQACADGPEAEAMARADIALIEELGISSSPVFFINGMIFLEPLYESIIMKVVCEMVMPGLQGCNLRKTGKANIIIIGDGGSSSLTEQGINKVKSTLEMQFSNYDLRVIDYESDEAQQLIERLNITYVPITVYDSTLLESDGYSELKYFVREEDGYYLQDSSPARHIDREEIPQSYVVFALAECPFSADFTRRQMRNVVENSLIRPEIHFIVREGEDGTLDSLHGQSEIDEGMRQVCMMKHYQEEYYDYLFCVNKNISILDELRPGCAEDAGIDMAAIEQCVEDEGRELLLENSKKAEEMDIKSTPTVVINNQLFVVGIKSSNAENYLCEENPDIDCGGLLEVYNRRKYLTTANICYQVPDAEFCIDFVTEHPEVREQTEIIPLTDEDYWKISY